MSTIEKSLPRIKGGEAINLIAEVLLEEGVDKRVAASMCTLVSDHLKRKVTICHDSLFEKRLRKICKENKHEMNEGNCRKVADEILDLFCNDPDKKISIFVHDNLNFVLSLIAVELSIIFFLLNYFLK